MKRSTYNMILYTIISSLLLMFALLWGLADGKASDFGLNAFTETLGILITIEVIDRLIKRRDELQALPQKTAAYEDIRQLTYKIVSLWSNAYQACIPEPSPSSISELFSEKSFKKIANNLNLNSRPNVTPSTTWGNYLMHNLSNHRTLGEKILERHNNILDPNVYGYIHQIAAKCIPPDTIKAIQKSEQELKIPSLPILHNYYFIEKEYIDAITGLVNWCNTYIKTLNKNGAHRLNDIQIKIAHWDKNPSPPSQISDDEITTYLNKKSTHCKK